MEFLVSEPDSNSVVEKTEDKNQYQIDQSACQGYRQAFKP